MNNLYADVAQWAVRTPEAAAIVTAERTLDYRTLDMQVTQYARLLQSRGVHSGTRVALVMAQELRTALIILALARLGATLCSIPRSATVVQKRQWADQLGVQHLLTDSPEPWLQQSHSASRILFDADASPVLACGQEEFRAPSDFVPEPQVPLMIVTGSGSTGRSKLLPLTHAQMRGRARALSQTYQVQPSDRLATMAHLEFAAGVHRLWNALAHGAGFVLFERGRVPWHELRPRLGVSILTSTVFHAEQMLAATATDPPYPLDGIRLVISGSIVSDELRQRIRDRLCRDLWIAYGCNEAWSMTAAGPQDCQAYPGTVGHPIKGTELRIVDEQLQPVADGVTGYIAVRSPHVISDYLGDPQASGKAFRDGWFMPGDLGRRTTDGHIIFCGRADNLMIFNGINIYPIEIEQCLLAHPSVAEAVAFPMRHPVHQDLPVAVVSLVPDSEVDEGSLQAFASRQLGFRQPRRIFTCSKIPRNTQGKPIKSELHKIMERALQLETEQGSEQQNADQIQIKFVWNASLQASKLEPWLHLLDLSESARPLAPAGASPEASAQDAATAFIERTLRLAQGLLHVLRQPVFDPLPVIDCRRTAGGLDRWQATSRWPDPALVSRQLVRSMLLVAFALASGVCKGDPSRPADRDLFFEALERDVLKPFEKSVPRGKSTFEVLRQAHSMGIPFWRVSGEVFQLGWGRHSILLDRSVTQGDSSMGMRTASNKWTCAQWLQQAGLPVPMHVLVRRLDEAQQVATSLGYPVVVKPADLERGEGVTVDVAAEGLQKAFESAMHLSPGKQVLVERQVPGVCHRLFVAAGQLLYAVKRLPIGVFGDGESSIADLVNRKRQAQMQLPPWRRHGRFELDDMALQVLERQGYTAQSIPCASTFVALRRIETTALGGIDEEVTELVHPENLKAALTAASLLGLQAAGVDIISRDITQPWFFNGAVINEVNYAPLLGGGDISRRHIPRFLTLWLPDRGRIPVHVLVGGQNAWQQALEQHQNLLEQNTAAFLTSDAVTVDSQGDLLRLTSTGLHERVRAILMRTDVACLVLVIHSVEVVAHTAPVDRVQSLRWVDQDLRAGGLGSLPAAPEAIERLRRCCLAWWPDQSPVTADAVA